MEKSSRQRKVQMATHQKKEDFTEKMKDVEEFMGQVFRVKTQDSEMKKLRENLPIGHVVAWMDFAENFTCSALEEVQPAYWNADMVTLHTLYISPNIMPNLI